MEIKRRMPLEEEWFDKKTNDILYGYLQAIATYNDEEQVKEKRLRLAKVKFQANKKVIKKIIGCSDVRTVNSKMKHLKELGYISEDEDNYYFPFEYRNNYYMIDKDLLYYICTTMSEFSVKTYIYLTDKRRMKENYQFSIKELKLAFGYAESTKTADPIITNCLALLKEAKLIDFHNEYIARHTKDGDIPMPAMFLDYVATELPDTTKETISEVKKTNTFKF